MGCYVDAIGGATRLGAARRHRNPAFTLVELLVIVSLIAMLLGIALPALSRARQVARLNVCLAHLREQAHVLGEYAVDMRGAVPPWLIQDEVIENGMRRVIRESLIGQFLEEWLRGIPHRPDEQASEEQPHGIWRCPSVRPTTRTESAYRRVHYATNAYIFPVVQYIIDGRVRYETYMHPGWEQTHGGQRWHRTDSVARPADILALADLPLQWHETGTAHLHENTTIENIYQIVDSPLFDKYTLSAHRALGKINAVFFDGHAEPKPLNPRYWVRGPVWVRGTDGRVYNDVNWGDVNHLLWMLRRWHSGQAPEED